MKFAIDGSTQNVNKPVKQNMITWKTKFRCAHFDLKMIRLTSTICPQQNFFLTYVDDIVRTVRSDIKELLEAVNDLHPNLQFTLETTDDKNSLPFLDMSINVKFERPIFAHGLKNHPILEQF